MSDPTFSEIIETAIDLAIDEGSTRIANSLRGEFPKPTNRLDAERYDKLIDKASWVLRERVKAIEQPAA